jgi:folate-binding protein YgfZ
MVLDTERLLTGYHDALTGAVMYRVPDAGYLRIGGADRADYIQRQSTNDVRTLKAGRALLTVLTTGTARMIDVWWLLAEPEGDAIGVITLPGRGAATARYLQGRIFFKDQVTVMDVSAAFAQFELSGPAAAQTLGVRPDLDQVVDTAINGADVRVIGLWPEVYGLIAPAAQADAIVTGLAAHGAITLSAKAYDVLRVEAGRPGPAQELTGDYTPLEANLDRAISGTKGCYSGQEVIARQITYDKVARRLVGLRLAEPVTGGAAVTVEGRTVGTVTSAAESPRFGAIALAVVRRPHFEPQTSVTVGDSSVTGEVVALPFGENA